MSDNPFFRKPSSDELVKIFRDIANGDQSPDYLTEMEAVATADLIESLHARIQELEAALREISNYAWWRDDPREMGIISRRALEKNS